MKSKQSSTNSTKKFQSFTSNPVIIGVATGLYPLIFYYSRNFGMINSWEQFGYFFLLFLIFPIVFFLLLKWFTKKYAANKWTKYAVPFFSIFLFLFFIKMILYIPIHRKIIVGIFIISVLTAYFLHKHFNKFVVIQLLLAIIGFFSLVPIAFRYSNYSMAWTEQPDDIKQVIFKKRPNIYYIQPDGYPSFSSLKSDFYKVDNSDFENYLIDKKFKNYPNFRSNYISTLTSNSATFMMKNHYYNRIGDYSEMINARRNIISNNTVLTIFKNNGYKTHFITERPYLMANRPKIGYDFTNFNYKEIPYRSTGLTVERNVYDDLQDAIASKNTAGNFFFVEFFQPSHITSTKSASEGKVKERENWLERRKIANEKIKNLVDLITQKDPGALIMIMADHGSFVGMDYTMEIHQKTSNPNIINSAFGAMLSIRWPQDSIPAIDKNLKTSVNVFRILFSYLSNEEKYLKNLQEDASYVILNENGNSGVYEYIDPEGNIVCKKI